MKKNYTPIKVLLTFICLFAFTALKAQTISTITDFTGSTVAKAYCINDQVHLKAAANTGNEVGIAVTYAWKRYIGTAATGTATPVGDGTIDMLDQPTTPGYYTYVSTTTYTIAGACESVPSAPVTIYVLPGITASISANGNPLIYCASAIPPGLILTATGANNPTSLTDVFAYNYQWYRNNTLISGATGSTYTVGTNAGDATVGTNSYTVHLSYPTTLLTSVNCTEGISTGFELKAVAAPGAPTISVQ